MSANRYAGTCATCHERVPAGAGFYDGTLWCAEPVRYEDVTGFRLQAIKMCPTAADLQERADRNNAKRRAAQVAPELTPEEMYAASSTRLAQQRGRQRVNGNVIVAEATGVRGIGPDLSATAARAAATRRWRHEP